MPGHDGLARSLSPRPLILMPWGDTPPRRDGAAGTSEVAAAGIGTAPPRNLDQDGGREWPCHPSMEKADLLQGLERTADNRAGELILVVSRLAVGRRGHRKTILRPVREDRP